MVSRGSSGQPVHPPSTERFQLTRATKASEKHLVRREHMEAPERRTSPKDLVSIGV